MNRHVTHVFIFASVCFLVWFCSFSKVQASPISAGTGNNINAGASSNQQTGQSENQPRPFGQKNDRQKIPKLQRNRLEEGKKSAPVRKRKKKQKSNKTKTAKKKREVNLSSDNGASHIANKRKKVKKINVTAERVDDIPLLIKAMVKMGIQEAIDQQIPIPRMATSNPPLVATPKSPTCEGGHVGS